MTKAELREQLPEVPSSWGNEFRRFLAYHTDGQFGKAYMTAKKVRYPIYRPQKELECPDADVGPVRYELAYECHCMSCDALISTASEGNSIRFWSDESGCLWCVDPESPDDPQWFCDEEDDIFELLGSDATFQFGDTICCPMCQDCVELIHPSKLRGGRLIQLMVETVEIIGEYAGVFHWLARKNISEHGVRISIVPRYAYIISKYGRLWKYRHVEGGGYTQQRSIPHWVACSDSSDCTDAIYHSWGSINNRRSCGLLYPHIPDLTGTTGEKTGLAMFWRTKNAQVVSYLKLWQHYPWVENLLSVGLSRMVQELAEKPYLLGLYTDNPMVDVNASKPHEVLRMTKSDMREIRKNPDAWDCAMHRLYAEHCRDAGAVSAAEFLSESKEFGHSGMTAAKRLAAVWPDTTFRKLGQYLAKQNVHKSEAQLLLDARLNAKRLAGGRALTSEELWPRNLIATHDRLAEEVDLLDHPDKYSARSADFLRIKAELSPLEWSDGDLCIVLPECSGDLVREGRKLRHCVGGYSDRHCSLQQTIFFVRHARRPERSYYTLSMNLLGVPLQNQLHGYGNERHGPHKEYAHTIPKKVLAFVQTWKQEVLFPWYEQQMKEVTA